MTDATERLQAVLGPGYRLDREIGRGGMATVYLAHDLKHGRRVAVKVLHPGLEVIGGAERFKREIEIAASLSHPNVLALIDSGSQDGIRWYLMPFVDGESLRQRLDREGQLSLTEALRITRAIGAALSHAHQKGLVHRDIKPENILLTADQVLVTDFGIARMAASNENLTATGFSLGTPNYMSPEQAMTSRQVDARSDQYSLGCVCYELIAGHPPFLGSSWQEVMGRHAIDSVPSLRSARPSVPPSLEKVLERSLAKTPADRYATVADFVAALPSDEELARTSTGTGAAAALEPRRRRSLRGLVGMLAVVVAIAVMLVVVWNNRPTTAGRSSDGRVLLAVLPLENLGKPEDEYFADGLSEEIANRLSRVRGIAVIARNTSIRASPTESLRDIGKRLGVRYVVGGTIQWARSDTGVANVAIRSELLDVNTGIRDGLDPFFGVLANVFELQTQLALQVVRQLRIQLGEAEQVAVQTSATTNVEAYRLYTLGRYQWKKRTADGLRQAVAAFDSALVVDPKYARALAGLADAYILYPQYGVRAIGGGEAFRRASDAATRALALDSTLAEAHASLGEIATYAGWDWAGAESHLRRAIALDSGYATAHHWYAELLTILGRQQEALEQGRAAVNLDPTSAVIAHAAAHPLFALRRYREAAAGFSRVLDLDPTFDYARFGLVRATALGGNLSEAEKLLNRFGDTTAFMHAWVRALVDTTRRPEARRLAEAGGGVAVAALPLHIRGPVLAGLARDDDALKMLEQAATDHHFAILGLKSEPLYDRLRGNPRFVKLLATVGLPPD